MLGEKISLGCFMRPVSYLYMLDPVPIVFANAWRIGIR